MPDPFSNLHFLGQFSVYRDYCLLVGTYKHSIKLPISLRDCLSFSIWEYSFPTNSVKSFSIIYETYIALFRSIIPSAKNLSVPIPSRVLLCLWKPNWVSETLTSLLRLYSFCDYIQYNFLHAWCRANCSSDRVIKLFLFEYTIYIHADLKTINLNTE